MFGRFLTPLLPLVTHLPVSTGFGGIYWWTDCIKCIEIYAVWIRISSLFLFRSGKAPNRAEKEFNPLSLVVVGAAAVENTINF